MFAAQVTVMGNVGGAAPLGRARQGERSEVAMPGRIGAPDAHSVCRVTDVSIAGARLQTSQPLTPESAVLLTLPGQPPRGARIIWSDDCTAGCAFDVPLADAALDDLVATYGFVPALREIATFRTQPFGVRD